MSPPEERPKGWLASKCAMLRQQLSSAEVSGMRPALTSLYCCSVAAASAVIAVYVLVAYTIAFAFELVWLIEANKEKFPPASAVLIICYTITLVATLALIHGLFTDNVRCLLIWLVCVILILIPECTIVFYMSISYWGLNNVYGASQMICYISRLPAIVAGVVIVQSCYAIKKANAKNGIRKISNNLSPLTESEFNASMYLPAAENGDHPPDGIYNTGFTSDDLKVSRSMPDLRKKMDSVRSKSFNHKMPIYMLPQTPPPYWLIPDANEQNATNAAYQQMYRKMPHFHPGHYGTLPRRYQWFESPLRPYQFPVYGYQPDEDRYVEYLNPERNVSQYEVIEKPRKISIDVTDSYKDNLNNEMKYRNFEHSSSVEGRGAGLRSSSAADMRYVMANPQMHSPYGVNLLPPKSLDAYKSDPFNFGVPRERVFYGPMQVLSTSHNSFGNESDDLTKYRDIAL